MKAVIALLFAFAVATNAALLKRPSPNGQLMSLAEISKHPLGSSLFSLAQLYSKDNSVGRIVPLLQEIYDDLVNDNNANEAQHEADLKYCADETERIETSIATNTDQYLAADQVRQTSEDNLAQLRPLLASIQEELANDRKALVDGQAERDRQHATYVSDKAQNEEAIAACKEAEAVLSSLLGGQSFIQLKDRMAKVTSALDKTKPSTHAHIYGPIIRALAQISTKADPDQIKKIQGLIENLRQQLQAALATIESDENAQAQAWSERRATLEQEIATGEKREKETQTLIEENEDSLADAQKRMAMHKKELNSLALELNNLKEDCARREQAYQTAKTEIARETEIVAAVIEHFEKHNDKLVDFIDNAPEGGEAAF